MAVRWTFNERFQEPAAGGTAGWGVAAARTPRCWEPSPPCTTPPCPGPADLALASLGVRQRPLVVATLVHGARAAHTTALGAAEEFERPTVAGTARAGLAGREGPRGLAGRGAHQLQHAAQRHVAAQLGALGEGLPALGALLLLAAPPVLDAALAEVVAAGERHRVVVENQADGAG